jgi:hypothetical protein
MKSLLKTGVVLGILITAGLAELEACYTGSMVFGCGGDTGTYQQLCTTVVTIGTSSTVQYTYQMCGYSDSTTNVPGATSSGTGSGGTMPYGSVGCVVTRTYNACCNGQVTPPAGPVNLGSVNLTIPDGTSCG